MHENRVDPNQELGRYSPIELMDSLPTGRLDANFTAVSQRQRRQRCCPDSRERPKGRVQATAIECFQNSLTV
ncbi:hypothetical protein EMEDMD4_790192 [Sinorhizobium medicae]|uniref:Uncharacterized protein n=1 Tax=Sinorhizobium medicae TaxID=110321 RepID=A0A508XAQ4_9HYPH|nr:hypothetical protein EMEDMD4_790192 [Sinorhizobium medicae]